MLAEKLGPQGKASAAADGPQWLASPTPFTAYSNGPGPDRTSTVLRLRPPASPFGRVFIVKMSLNDNEYSWFARCMLPQPTQTYTQLRWLHTAPDHPSPQALARPDA